MMLTIAIILLIIVIIMVLITKNRIVTILYLLTYDTNLSARYCVLSCRDVKHAQVEDINAVARAAPHLERLRWRDPRVQIGRMTQRPAIRTQIQSRAEQVG